MPAPPRNRNAGRGRAAVARLVSYLAIGAMVPCAAAARESVDAVPGPGAAGPAAAVVVARVDGQPIRLGEVLYEMRQRALGHGVAVPEVSAIQAAMLQHLVRRSLVLQYLSRSGLAASPQDVDFRLEQQRRRLTGPATALEDALKQQGLDLDIWRQRIAWQLSWPPYVERYLGEEYLKKQFALRRRDYDGTQVRVAHILLRIPPAGQPRGDRAEEDRTVQRAAEIRRQITSGELDFATAARQGSEAPTADRAGDLGFISRHEPMPETFSRVAFALQPGETSDPVVTRFGVHLIHCLEVKPGQARWQDVRDALREDLSRRVFGKLAERERGRARVEYTGSMPYIDPESGRLVGAEHQPRSP